MPFSTVMGLPPRCRIKKINKNNDEKNIRVLKCSDILWGKKMEARVYDFKKSLDPSDGWRKRGRGVVVGGWGGGMGKGRITPVFCSVWFGFS